MYFEQCPKCGSYFNVPRNSKERLFVTVLVFLSFFCFPFGLLAVYWSHSRADHHHCYRCRHNWPT